MQVKEGILKAVPEAQVLIKATDVTNGEDVKALVQAAEDSFGPVNILVNNGWTLPPPLPCQLF